MSEGIIIVPSLVFLLGLTQHEAQGKFICSCYAGCMVGIINYWKDGNVQWKFGLIVAIAFFVGAYFGSKLSLKLNPNIVKFMFGILMALVSVKLILSSCKSIIANDD